MQRKLFACSINVYLLGLILWAALLCTPYPPLPDGACLLTAAILYAVGAVVCIVEIFLPELPRLPREKGSSRPSPLL